MADYGDQSGGYSDQAIRDIVAQLVSNGQPAPQAAAPGAPLDITPQPRPAPEEDTPPVPQMGSMAAPSIMPAAPQMGSVLAAPAPTAPQIGSIAAPPSPNLAAAHAALNLSPQEQALYGRHLTNLNGPGGVDNPDGSRSTLYQSVQEHNGKFYNIPTVWDGKRETEPYTQPQTGRVFDVPNQTTLANVNKAGWDSFPSYETPEAADSRYDQMHSYMERDTADYLKQRGQ